MTTLLHNPPNESIKDEMYVWVSVDEGGEGIMGANIDGLGWTTLMSGKLTIAMKMEPLAIEAAKLGNKTVRLVKYSRAEVIKEIKP